MSFDRITCDPNRLNGQPCIRDLRLTVRRVVEAVAAYPDRDELRRDHEARGIDRLGPERVGALDPALRTAGRQQQRNPSLR